MSDCCGAKSEPASKNTAECPVSGTKGVTVELRTVKAVLTNAALRRVTAAAHRFYADPECDIVYFADNGTTYLKGDIRAHRSAGHHATKTAKLSVLQGSVIWMTFKR